MMSYRENEKGQKERAFFQNGSIGGMKSPLGREKEEKWAGKIYGTKKS